MKLPKKGNTRYKGSTHRSAIPNPLRIFPFNPRNENNSFGLITTIVRIKVARVRSKAFIDSPRIELFGISNSVVTKPMFLQKRIIVILARMEYSILAAFGVI